MMDEMRLTPTMRVAIATLLFDFMEADQVPTVVLETGGENEPEVVKAGITRSKYVTLTLPPDGAMIEAVVNAPLHRTILKLDDYSPALDGQRVVYAVVHGEDWGTPGFG